MPRVLIAAVSLLAGCYASHERPDDGTGATVDAGSVLVMDTTRPGPDGLPLRCLDGSAQTVVVGPTRECRELSVAPRGAVECSTLGGRQRGAPVRVVRAAVGRVDMRVSCVAPCAVHGISPDSCDGCLAFTPRDGHVVPTFADLQVGGLVELVIEGRAILEVCFDPDYGPPPWGG